MESVIYSNFAEHENERHHMNWYIQENCHGPKSDLFLFGQLLDCGIEDGPVYDDDDDVKYKASRIQELQKP